LPSENKWAEIPAAGHLSFQFSRTPQFVGEFEGFRGKITYTIGEGAAKESVVGYSTGMADIEILTETEYEKSIAKHYEEWILSAILAISLIFGPLCFWTIVQFRYEAVFSFYKDCLVKKKKKH
jgi:hypothetical protein